MKKMMTKSMLGELEKAYAEAKKSGVEVFDFMGETLLVDYAKYLIEHLGNVFREDSSDMDDDFIRNAAKIEELAMEMAILTNSRASEVLTVLAKTMKEIEDEFDKE